MAERFFYLCNSQADASALIAAGKAAVGLSPHPLTPQSEKYGWLHRALTNGFKDVDRYVLAPGNDSDGLTFRHEVVAILGAAKCWFVDWPYPMTGAAHFLEDMDAERLKAYLETAKPWPVEGLYGLDEMPEAPPLELWRTGFDEIGARVCLAPTMISVVTGFPGHGKSAMWTQIWHQIARKHEIGVAMFAAETRIKPHLRRQLRECYHGELQRRQTPAQIVEADEFIQRKFLFMQHPAEKPNMTWLMDMIEVAAIRHGCRAIVIDPWNKIEPDYDPRATTETAWIGWCLDRFIELARSLNIHIQIIAHPAKPEAVQRKNPPDLYSISGSAHWNNRVDQGFVVYREKLMDGVNRATAAQLICTKARFQELGYPSRHEMNMNLETGLFECVPDPQKPLLVSERGDDGYSDKQAGLF